MSVDQVAGLWLARDLLPEMAQTTRAVAVAAVPFAMEPTTSAGAAQPESWSFVGLPTQRSHR